MQLHLGQCDRSSYDEDVTAWESEHRLLEGVVDERPEFLAAERRSDERRLVRAVDDGGVWEPGVAAGGRLVQLYERRSALEPEEEGGDTRTMTWPLPGGSF
ncbi:hypothetical protein IMZ48_29665 [Candidatus Bathyarchaeota archaeon]|nr:hypothetical protein [Candidatus Bathyarchaeota archaeon]